MTEDGERSWSDEPNVKSKKRMDMVIEDRDALSHRLWHNFFFHCSVSSLLFLGFLDFWRRSGSFAFLKLGSLPMYYYYISLNSNGC